jgi:hypothetical protein
MNPIDCDPTQWEGDPELLEQYTEELLNNQTACEITFASKHEAFLTGFRAGQTQIRDLTNTGE